MPCRSSGSCPPTEPNEATRGSIRGRMAVSFGRALAMYLVFALVARFSTGVGAVTLFGRGSNADHDVDVDGSSGAVGSGDTLGEHQAIYPTTYDNTVGTLGTAAMDAIIYPDPLSNADVHESARKQCILSPHILFVGAQAKHNNLDNKSVGCLFYDSKGKALRTDAWIYPPANGTCGTEQYDPQGWVNKFPVERMLACMIPRVLVAAYSDTHNVIRVALTDAESKGTPRSKVFSAIGAWDNGVNPALTKLRPKKHRLAATYMYNSAGPNIRSWIAWHRMKGVEHFFVYDNNAEEDESRHLADYEQQGIVTRIQWPYCCAGPDNNIGQRAAMNHALFKFGQVTDWLISIDSDEYLITDVPDIVNKLEQLSGDLDLGFVGIKESYIMEPGCAEAQASLLPNGTKVFGKQRLRGEEMFGKIPVAASCPPKMSARPYNGKLFARTLYAYRIGFDYFTPHSNIGLPRRWYRCYLDEQEASEIGIAHFRSDFLATPSAEARIPMQWKTQSTTTARLYENFMSDFKRYFRLT